VISFDSAPGSTCFTILLPAAEAASGKS
jgi:hypothetical protein